MLTTAGQERTYLNCTWAERRILASAPLWLEAWRSHWCCLALSEKSGRLTRANPANCATCPLWHPRTSPAPLSHDEVT